LAYRSAGLPAGSPGLSRVDYLLSLQRTAGNRAVNSIVVQRKAADWTPTAAQIPGVLMKEPTVASHLPDKGGAAPTIKVLPRDEFTAAFRAYAKQIGDKSVEEKFTWLHVDAFTNLETNVIYLDGDHPEPGTRVHESLHVHSDRQWISRVAPGTNEGATEFFTRRVCDQAGVARKTTHFPAQVDAIQRLVDHSSVEALAAAYFDHDFTQLKLDLDKISVGLWQKWDDEMATGKVDTANALLP
jgi:hypothetical protein